MATQILVATDDVAISVCKISEFTTAGAGEWVRSSDVTRRAFNNVSRVVSKITAGPRATIDHSNDSYVVSGGTNRFNVVT